MTVAPAGAAVPALTTSYSSTVRVTVVTPQARVDVALPVQSTLAELIPQLIRVSAAEGQSNAENPGWVLTRLGGAALQVGLTVSAAKVQNGEVLYLSPRERHVAPLLFDDVVDAIASNAENRSGAWSPRSAYRLAMVAMAVVVFGATWLLISGLWGSLFVPVACGVVAVAGLLSGGALARAYSDAEAGAVAGAVGVPAAALAGMTALPPHLLSVGAAPLATALAAVTVYAVLAIVLIAHRLPWWFAVVTVGALGALIAAISLLTGVTPVGVAAGGGTVATALAATSTMIALRLARLPLPRVPADMDAFRADEKPTLGQTVLERTETAENILTALLGGLGTIVAACSLVLVIQGSVWETALAGVFGLVWLLRSRSYAGTTQRVAMIATGLAALACLGAWVGLNASHTIVLGGAVVLLAAGVICVIYAGRVVRNRKSPYWARLLDFVEFVSLMAMVPLFGVITGLYVAVRAAI
jgi:type VII secretion integral membrane protein EccD